MRNALLATGLLVALAMPALAHEKGAIYLASKTVGRGGELVLRGERLPKSGIIRLQLRGTLETFSLGEQRIDTAGRFQGKVSLPAQVAAGTYTVVALASDGDVVARADLIVTQAAAPAPGAMADMDHAGMPGMTDSSGVHPTAEMMDVPVNTSGGEWAVIAAIIGLSAAGGLVLLARPRGSAV